jgi:hypothetical protein
MRLEFQDPQGASGSYPLTGWTKQATLSDVFPVGPDGIYQCRLIVEEDGSSVVQYGASFRLNVSWTSGEISGHETWATNQVLSGSLTILSGASLTLAPGVIITVANVVELVGGRPRPDGSPTITVEKEGTLVLGDGVVIQPTGWRQGTTPEVEWQYWGGIYAGGTLQAGSAIIRGAIRGVIALAGSTVTLQGTRFEQNRTGVHAYGSGADPVISGAVFSESARYGIKEDAGASPIVTSSAFMGNTYDYYDTQLTVVDAEGINGLSPLRNSGNHDVPPGQ